MCFTSSSKNPRVKIAKEDIMVIKFLSKYLNNRIYSYWEEYNYTNKEGEILPIVKLKVNVFEIYEGYHSWNKKYNNTSEWEYGFKKNLYNPFYMYALFMIPKGAKYYSNKNGEMVSETISFIGLI